MKRFTIGIFGRDTNPHAQCFEDFAKALAHALKALGHELVGFNPRTAEPLGRLIAFGINNAAIDDKLVGEKASRYALPADAIVFNTEQLAAVDVPEKFIQGVTRYRDNVVWDYAACNLPVLASLGVKNAVHCPLGYVPSMTHIQPAAEEDIDVLFYGSTNEHRLKVLDALDAAGLDVMRLFGIYGAERDAYIARAKVVLNMHHYERGIFEIFRVSHLVANGKCVVSEAGGCDAELEHLGKELTAFVPYDALVTVCKALVQTPAARHAQAIAGFEAFKKLDLVESVRKALEQSGV